MKDVFYAIALLLLITACGESEDKSRIKKAVLAKTWFFSKANLIDAGFNEFRPLTSDQQEENSPILNFVEFDANGNLWMDTGGAAPFKGKYLIMDSLITMTFEQNAMPQMKLISMPTLDTSRFRFYRDYMNTNDKIVYELNEVKGIPIANNNWSKPLADNASDADIKVKLKSMVDYYTTYCSFVGRMNKQFFKPERIDLPFMLYNGGIGLKEIKNWDAEFATIIGSEANKTKAHALLTELFKKDYVLPGYDNLMSQYADFFAFCSKQFN